MYPVICIFTKLIIKKKNKTKSKNVTTQKHLELRIFLEGDIIKPFSCETGREKNESKNVKDESTGHNINMIKTEIENKNKIKENKNKNPQLLKRTHHLRTRITTNGPANRPLDFFLQQGVFLFNTIPVSNIILTKYHKF